MKTANTNFSSKKYNLMKSPEMKALIDAHETVKCHIFRMTFDENYRKPYGETLIKFAKASLEPIGKWLELVGASKTAHYTFYHDFISSAIKVRNGVNRYYSQSDIDEHTLHVEKCIGYIHRFIETGEFNKFENYYSGCNYYKAMGRWTTCILDLNCGYFLWEYDEEKFKGVIKEIKQKRKQLADKGKDPDASFLLHSKKHLNHFVKRLKEGK